MSDPSAIWDGRVPFDDARPVQKARVLSPEEGWALIRFLHKNPCLAFEWAGPTDPVQAVACDAIMGELADIQRAETLRLISRRSGF
jgi:hypothetical protein